GCGDAIEAEAALDRRGARPCQVERGDRCALPGELRRNRAETASDFEHAPSAQRRIIDEAAKERLPRPLREPGGAPEFAVDAAEETARGRVVGQVGPPPMPEIVHWMLVPPETDAAGDVVGGGRQGGTRRAIIESSSCWTWSWFGVPDQTVPARHGRARNSIHRGVLRRVPAEEDRAGDHDAPARPRVPHPHGGGAAARRSRPRGAGLVQDRPRAAG